MAKAAKKKQQVYIKTDPKRIEVLGVLIAEGYIKTWADIFETIPRTSVATHLGVNNNRMKALVEDPSTMTLEMQAKVAAFLQVKYSVLSELTYKAMPLAKKKIK